MEAITAKMIRRHPHIFADVKADDAETVLTNWEEIKKQENGRTARSAEHYEQAAAHAASADESGKRCSRKPIG